MSNDKKIITPQPKPLEKKSFPATRPAKPNPTPAPPATGPSKPKGK